MGPRELPRELRWLALGFAAATLAAAIVDSRPAAAQTAAEAASEASEPSAPAPSAAADDPEESEDGEETGEDGSPRARIGQRPAVVDGDLGFPAEPEAPLDGAVEPEPEAPLDGADPVAIDNRDDEDRGLFDNPPAGFDPLLFQIEDLDPILDRRPERLFRFEPYDPIGIRVGSFIYFPETEVSGAYFSNVFDSPEPDADTALEIRTKSRLVSNWSVHALEFKSSSNTSFHSEFDSEDDREYALEALGRLDIRRTTNLQGSVSHERTQESRGDIDASASGDRTEIETNTGNLALTHRFNRLEAQLRTSITDRDYGETDDGFGGIVTNAERDTRIREQELRLTYELKPSFAVFAEGGLNQRGYDVPTPSDDLRRDSVGQRYRFGVDFGDAGEVLRGEIAFGYALQDPDEAALGEVDGFLFDANVTWRISDLTALRLTGRTDIVDTTQAFSGGVLTHEIGLEARHAFRRYFIGTAGITYSSSAFSGVDILEDTLSLKLDAEYFANRELILFASYEHEEFFSTEPDEDYESDEVRVGLRYRR